MRLLSLSLKNFRNIDALALEPSGGKNIFLGENGQGKTNLLEAIYFLSHSRSNRTTTDRELLQTGAPAARAAIIATPHRYEGKTLLESQISLQGETAGSPPRLKTHFKVNATPLRSRSQLLGYLPTVSFFLSDLLLLRGTPEDRRRWLDAAIVQYQPAHFAHLAAFQKIRLQKSRLLKEPPERISGEHLETWNLQFAQAASLVMAGRLAYLALFQDRLPTQYLALAGKAEPVTVSYATSLPGLSGLAALSGGTPTAEALEARLLEQLQHRQAEEIRRATCLVGPHRDDIRFTLSERDACAYGSQGQQRSIVLALKLLELALLTEKLQEPPVLLLDDVMAELDPQRQRHLIEHMPPESQMFLTTTHLDASLRPLVQGLAQGEEVAIHRVAQGVVSVESAFHSASPAPSLAGNL